MNTIKTTRGDNDLLEIELPPSEHNSRTKKPKSHRRARSQNSRARPRKRAPPRRSSNEQTNRRHSPSGRVKQPGLSAMTQTQDTVLVNTQPKCVKPPKQAYEVKNACTSYEENELQTRYPHVDFSFTEVRQAHPHILLNVGRRIGELQAINHLKPYTSKLFPILDVGFSTRNRRKTVHGCESTAGIASTVKFERAYNRFPQNRISDDRVHDGSAWTYCNCDAETCPHGEFGCAMFIHSIYYNTADKVCRILHRTRSKRGVAIFHPFTNNGTQLTTGHYGLKEDTAGRTTKHYAESCFRRTKTDNIVMYCNGNTDTYVHPNVDWLTIKRRHAIEINGQYYVLDWNLTQVDRTGEILFADFILIKAQAPIGDWNRPNDDLSLADENLKGIIDRLKVIKIPGGQIIEPSRHWFTWRSKIGKVEVPMAMLTHARRFLVGKKLDDKVMASLSCELRGKAKPKLYPEVSEKVGLSEAGMTSAIYTVMKVAMEMNMDDSAALTNFYSFRNFIQVKKHNARVSFAAWQLILIRILLGISAISILFLILVPIVRSLVLAIADDTSFTRFLGNSVVSILMYSVVGPAIGILLFIAVFSYGFTSNATNTTGIPDPSGPSNLIVYITTACVIVLSYFMFKLFYKWLRHNYWRYNSWDEFKRNVTILRKTTHSEGPVRKNDPLRSQETWTDPEQFPTRDKAWIKVTKNMLHVKKPTPAVMPIGVIFSYCAPLVYSTSQWNLYVALKTRSVLKVKPAEPGMWKKCYALMHTHLGTFKGLKYPEPYTRNVEYTYRNVNYERCFPAPEYFTWKKYVNRFPNKGKRANIERAAVRLTSGMVDPRQWVANAFVKREKQNLITYDDFKPQRPRTIQGACEYIKPAGGLWFLAHSKALGMSWNVKNWIWYCSGFDVSAYNFWISHHIDRLGGIGNVFFLWSDYSKYDLTQGKCEFEEMRIPEYKRLGIERLRFAKEIIKLMQKTRGYGYGIKYYIEYTQKSGFPDTSSGNSLATGIAVASAFLMMLAEAPLYVALAVLGDDNFSIISYDIFKYCSLSSMKELARALEEHQKALGLVPKIGTSMCPFTGEFLSKKFYPVADGYAFGCKPARVLAKIGYMMYKQNVPDEEWMSMFLATLHSYGPTANHVPFLRKYIEVVSEYVISLGIKPSDKYDRADFYRLCGIKSVANDETWEAFTSMYDLTREDESTFEAQLQESLRLHGMPCMVDMPILDKLFEKEIDF